MNSKQIVPANDSANGSVSLLVATGLTFASLIVVPVVAAQIGLGPSVTSALRIALMKASNRALRG